MLNTNLKGKTALVCGASGGIGAAIAKSLGELGARVIGVARTEDKLRSVLREIPDSRLLVCDVTDHAKLRSLVEAELQACGGAIEILVNNSSGPKGGPITDAALDEFSKAFHQHVLTNQLLAQTLIPGMKSRGFGRILNVISTSVRMPIPGLGVSNTVRAATASWAKTLASEVAPFGITVNSVLPGYTRTERLSSLIKAAAEKSGKTEVQVAEEWKAVTPVKRFGEPEEIAAAVAFLASPSAGFITGVALPVDGGRIGAI